MICVAVSPSLPHPRDAAALACVCANTARAYREGHWPRAVRVKRSGAVLEPFSGTFDVTVAPGEDVQDAVDRCPLGGCVLLQPGRHEGHLVLAAGQEVHVFGRGQATLRSTTEIVLKCEGASATVDGVSLKRLPATGGGFLDRCIYILSGALRLQTCDIISAVDSGISAWATDGAEFDLSLVECKCVERLLSSCPGGGDDATGRLLSERRMAPLPSPPCTHIACVSPAPPLFRSVYDCASAGIFISGAGARAHLEGSTVARCGEDGISIHGGASVDVMACRIHDIDGAGVNISGNETRCRLEGNQIWGNGCGVSCRENGDPLLIANTIRDHPVGEESYRGVGLHVADDAAGCATVRPDNVFERNARGDVVRA